jgi:hypothetical protein
VTALEPSATACFLSSPGNTSLTVPSISLDDSVTRPVYFDSLAASSATLSNMSLIRLFRAVIAFDDIPIPGCTCFNTLNTYLFYSSPPPSFLLLFLFLSLFLSSPLSFFDAPSCWELGIVWFSSF